jgi:hypothetical protein
MRKRYARRAWLGIVAGVATAFAVGGLGPVASAVSPSGESAAAKQYADKVTICHHTGSKKKPFHTISVAAAAVPAHLNHGDTLGPCPTTAPSPTASTKGKGKGKGQTKGKGKGNTTTTTTTTATTDTTTSTTTHGNGNGNGNGKGKDK